ncbi:hypothetical protein V7100_03870 [Priestia megaterium]|uniref:hypothetical protein n=1 Tax=Priestia megaterium TaxID=1404 RepID=UPI0030007A8A
MAYNTKKMLRDIDEKLIPQFYDPVSDSYKPLVDPRAGSSTLTGKVKNVTNAGTATALDDIACREVTVIAKKGNTGSIYVGGSDVSDTTFGVELKANEAFTFPVNNAKLIYINASVSGEGVSYVAL